MLPTHRPVRSDDYHLELLDGELLLFHPSQTTIIACNPIASLIWQLCDGQRTTAEITTLLQTAYPEAATSIPADLETLLQQFTRHGAINFVKNNADSSN